MSLPVKAAPLPSPPGAYDAEYMAQLIASMERYIRALNAAGPVVMTNFQATQMPGNGFGLPAGTLYHHNGVVRVAQPYDLFYPTLTATMRLGAVTTL